jgi:hypothetical protein
VCTRAVGALCRRLEEAGIATAHISLVREHTARMRPPRALFVPYRFGRPFGRPNDSALQKRILRALLALLQRGAGPILEDFSDHAMEDREGTEALWSCPIPGALRFSSEPGLERAFTAELSEIQPWYGLSLERRGRTSVGISGLSVDEIAAFLPRLLDERLPGPARSGQNLGMTLARVALDLRAMYGEAATAKSDRGTATPEALEDWFWNETRAAELLRAIRQRFRGGPDQELSFVVEKMLVPIGR